MQDIKDMKEVLPGMYVPTEKCYVQDDGEWRWSHRGYSCIRHRETREILLVFINELDGVKYALSHFDVPIFSIGGVSASDELRDGVFFTM